MHSCRGPTPSTRCHAADGVTKIKGGGAQFLTRVSGDLPTFSALALGVISKGIGVGALIEVQIGINVAGTTPCGPTTCNGLILGCNTGAQCPAPPLPAPVTALDLITNPNSYIEIAIPDNADCTGLNTPLRCCTGAGTGTCS